MDRNLRIDLESELDFPALNLQYLHSHQGLKTISPTDDDRFLAFS